LRARRARLRPEQVGLPRTVGRRRTPGLRREELAAVAGLSVDYYIRLEQGRERNPSPAVVEALAVALHLDRDERSHLFALTHHAAGRHAASPLPPPVVPSSTAELLARLRPWPALVLARNGDILAANPEGVAIYTGLDDWPVRQRNTIRYVFTHPAARTILGDWEHAAATSVANLRHLTATDPDAPDLQAIHDELARASADFRRLWAQHDVRPRRASTKTFHHPMIGDIMLQHQTWHLDDLTMRLSLYQPEPAYLDQLTLLAMHLDVGSQTWS
jgi:transcriptional regulator with XRE-family HTH domain